MGVDMNVTASQVAIKKDHHEKVLKKLEIIDGRQFYSRGDWPNGTTLTEAFKRWCWSPRYDEGGNIIDLTYEAEKEDNNRFMFEQIAAWIEDGSYIDIEYPGYGEGVRFKFRNKSLEVVKVSAEAMASKDFVIEDLTTRCNGAARKLREGITKYGEDPTQLLRAAEDLVDNEEELGEFGKEEDDVGGS